MNFKFKSTRLIEALTSQLEDQQKTSKIQSSLLTEKTDMFNRMAEALEKQQGEFQAFQTAYNDRLNNPPPSPDSNARGNRHKSYSDQVCAAWKMFEMKAQYGGLPLRKITRHVAAQIGGNGASITAPEGTPEAAALKAFLEVNPIDKVVDLIPLIRIGLYEGQLLFFPKKMEADEEEKRAATYKLIPMRWYDYRYIVKLDKEDRDVITDIEIGNEPIKTKWIYCRLEKDGNSGQAATGDQQQGTANEPTPPFADILSTCENIDAAAADERSMNALLGLLEYIVETENWANAEKITTWVDSKKGDWNIGDFAAWPGKAQILEPSGASGELIQNEMTTQTLAAGAAHAVGPLQLGYAKEMNNRATAEEQNNENELIHTTTREGWNYWLLYIIKEVFALLNNPPGQEDNLPVQLDWRKVTVQMRPVAYRQKKDILEYWAPLVEKGYITQDTVREKIPDINAAEEKKKLDAEADNEQKNLEDEIERDRIAIEEEERKREEEENARTNSGKQGGSDTGTD